MLKNGDADFIQQDYCNIQLNSKNNKEKWKCIPKGHGACGGGGCGLVDGKLLRGNTRNKGGFWLN